MSVQEIARAETRARVNRFLWDNYIDPTHQVIEPAYLPAAPGLPTGRWLNLYNQVLNHFNTYLFGNIAIIGSFGMVNWPNVGVPVPGLEITVPAEGGQAAQIVNINSEFNLSVVCPALEAARRASGYAPLQSGTFQSMCEAYAQEAVVFLRERRAYGVHTNIYNRWPRALDPAPWMAFDFACGLNMSLLTSDEKLIVERMTKRVFRTKGQQRLHLSSSGLNPAMPQSKIVSADYEKRYVPK